MIPARSARLDKDTDLVGLRVVGYGVFILYQIYHIYIYLDIYKYIYKYIEYNIYSNSWIRSIYIIFIRDDGGALGDIGVQHTSPQGQSVHFNLQSNLFSDSLLGPLSRWQEHVLRKES